MLQRCDVGLRRSLLILRFGATIWLMNRVLLGLSCCALSCAQLIAADMTPAGNGPVFQIFTTDLASGGGAPKIDISGKQPVMIVTAAADVRVSKDHKAVRFTFTGNEARRFADLTRKHRNEFLILQGNGKVLEAMQVSSPVTNGILEFSYPEDAAVADYLKKRFRLK